jgi:GntR family transcriptional regulator
MLTSRIASRFAKHPLYLQVRDAMAERIAAGEWKPSATIPNEGDLAREFGVSPGTMRKALDLLEVERLLTRRQGRGTFVNDQSSAELAVRYSNIREDNGAHAGNEVEILDITEGIAEEAECRRLYVRAHEKVLRICRLRRRDRKPYMLEDVVIPLSLFPGLSQASAPSHRIVVLAQQYGLLLGKGEERITIGSASLEVASILEVKAAVPLLVLDRVVHTLAGQPVEWRVGQCHIAGMHYLAEFK